MLSISCYLLTINCASSCCGCCTSPCCGCFRTTSFLGPRISIPSSSSSFASASGTFLKNDEFLVIMWPLRSTSILEPLISFALCGWSEKLVDSLLCFSCLTSTRSPSLMSLERARCCASAYCLALCLMWGRSTLLLRFPVPVQLCRHFGCLPLT